MQSSARAVMIGRVRRVPARPRRVARPLALALLLTAAMPVCAAAETIFDGFLSRLVPNLSGAHQEPPPAPPDAQAKSQPRKNKPIAITPGTTARTAASRSVPVRSNARPSDRDIITGAMAQAPAAAPPPAPSQPQAQPQSPPQGSSLTPAPVSAAPLAPPKPAAAAPAPKPPAKPRNEAAKGKPPAQPTPPAVDPDGDAAQFCRNITDAAADARFTWQVQMLEDLDKRVKESSAKLEAKRAEYEDWLKRREDFLRKVEDGVVEMYGRMRPDAAAQQIASMTEEVALSVLMKLKPRAASAILGEMEPARAARLTDSLAGVRLTTREQGKTP